MWNMTNIVGNFFVRWNQEAQFTYDYDTQTRTHCTVGVDCQACALATRNCLALI